jgi:hypothetical protein
VTDKYGKLKAELIKRLTASNENKIKQLLMHEELETIAVSSAPKESRWRRCAG